MGTSARVLLTILLAVPAGCVPTWTDDPALVTGSRIIAITAEPPEGAPGSRRDPDRGGGQCGGSRLAGARVGVLQDAQAAVRKRSGQSRVRDGSAAARVHRPLRPFPRAYRWRRAGYSVRRRPPGYGDRPPLRPRDPDPTGGYYQPVRAAGAGPVAFGAVRILCNLASAPLEAALELRRRYRPNQNPRLAGISATLDGDTVPLDALPVDRAIDLVAHWGAEAAEVYPAFDPAAQALRERRESLRVSWYVTAGTILHHQTGRAEMDSETSVSTIWRSPPEPTPGLPIHLWAVFRDSRGGVSAEHRELTPAAPSAR